LSARNGYKPVPSRLSQAQLSWTDYAPSTSGPGLSWCLSGHQPNSTVVKHSGSSSAVLNRPAESHSWGATVKASVEVSRRRSMLSAAWPTSTFAHASVRVASSCRVECQLGMTWHTEHDSLRSGRSRHQEKSSANVRRARRVLALQRYDEDQ